MDLNARVDVNCGQKDGRTDGRKNRAPKLRLAKAGVTKMSWVVGKEIFNGEQILLQFLDFYL